MKALIIGGTAFLGIALREALAARGHAVTLFNRGRSAASPAGFRTIRGDRERGFDTLAGERFDAVVDTSGYVPHVVERSARFFESRAHRYVFISSVSVFDLSLRNVDEHAPMPALPEGASRTVMTGETYGPLKAMCERVVASAFRTRSTIVRPGLIVGPHDTTDRFTYWPLRFARGGDVLAPGTPDRATQFVDARDLAAFVVKLVEDDRGGDYNATSPQGRFTMDDVMNACADVARVPTRVAWADDEWLLRHEVKPWMGDDSLPLWIPPSLGIPGLLDCNVRKASTAGLTIRSLRETARATLAWALRTKHRATRSGLSADREAALLGERS